jgi:hypothetical protein
MVGNPWFKRLRRGGFFHKFLSTSTYCSFMERRTTARKPVLMSAAIALAGTNVDCLVRNISISGAAIDVGSRQDIPERFDLVFKVDGAQIPCHVVWREDEQIGVAFD